MWSIGPGFTVVHGSSSACDWVVATAGTLAPNDITKQDGSTRITAILPAFFNKVAMRHLSVKEVNLHLHTCVSLLVTTADLRFGQVHKKYEYHTYEIKHLYGCSKE